METRRKLLVGAALTTSLVISGGGVATGATQQASATQVVGGESRATAAETELPVAKYSDDEVLQFLVFGDGRVSEDNPGLADSLGFKQAEEGADRSAANALIADYHAAHPQVVARISANLQSGSPVHVDRALQEFATSLNAYAQKVYNAKPAKSKDVYSTNGSNWAWTATWLAAAAVVAAGAAAVVYGAVAGFHAGVAVTVIYLVYLPEMQGSAPSTIEKDTMVSTIASGLSD